MLVCPFRARHRVLAEYGRCFSHDGSIVKSKRMRVICHWARLAQTVAHCGTLNLRNQTNSSCTPPRWRPTRLHNPLAYGRDLGLCPPILYYCVNLACQWQIELSADGASVVVTLVCRYDGRGDVVMFIAWTPPAMRELMVAAV